MRTLILLALAMPLGFALGGCAWFTPPRVEIAAPCGVIADSLVDVMGATPADTRRIDNHFERGVEAKCWERPK